MKAATDYKAINEAASMISIHAAREGGDADGLPLRAEARAISIHAAREGGDLTRFTK